MKYSIRGFHFIHKLLKGIPNWGHNYHMGWQQIWIVLPLVSIDYTWDYICFQGVPIWGSICNISYHPQMFQGSPLLGFIPPIDWGYFLQMDTPLVPYLPHCLKQFLQGISPWGHICHIEWNLFYKVFPLGALAATLVEKIGWVFFLQEVPPWVPICYIGRSILQGILPLGCRHQMVWNEFDKGLSLWCTATTLADIHFRRGPPSRPVVKLSATKFPMGYPWYHIYYTSCNKLCKGFHLWYLATTWEFSLVAKSATHYVWKHFMGFFVCPF